MILWTKCQLLVFTFLWTNRFCFSETSLNHIGHSQLTQESKSQLNRESESKSDNTLLQNKVLKINPVQSLVTKTTTRFHKNYLEQSDFNQPTASKSYPVLQSAPDQPNEDAKKPDLLSHTDKVFQHTVKKVDESHIAFAPPDVRQVVPPKVRKVVSEDDSGSIKSLREQATGRGIDKILQRPKYKIPPRYIYYQHFSSSSHYFKDRKSKNIASNSSVSWDLKDFTIQFKDRSGPPFKLKRAPRATLGEPWPLPQIYKSLKYKVYQVEKDSLQIKVVKHKCDIIDGAVERFKRNVFKFATEELPDNLENLVNSGIKPIGFKNDSQVHAGAPVLKSIEILIINPCTGLPTEQSQEAYDVTVNREGIKIYAKEVWGALHGLETLSQLIYTKREKFYVRDTVIKDYPRFKHRGILIDTSRHYIKKSVMKEVIDGMGYNKMNVLHWHIVDDQSFPYQSKVFPDLSKKGAFHPTLIYTHEDIAEIIDYARLRGVRVMPEFDVPGHTFSWGLGYPELLTQCYNKLKHPIPSYLGPINPSRNASYEFLVQFFKEVFDVFQDNYVHLGGDEVPLECWFSNPEVRSFLFQLNGYQNLSDSTMKYGDPMLKVLNYFTSRVITELKDLAKEKKSEKRFVLWEESLKNNLSMPRDTIINIWMSGDHAVQKAVERGYNVIYSTCWYLDNIEKGILWHRYYECDPNPRAVSRNFVEEKVLGGEACLWSEYITSDNVISLLWPRASAVAERLWSNVNVVDLDAASVRLEEQSCRMYRRGLGVGHISGPGYCLPAAEKSNSVSKPIVSNTGFVIDRLLKRPRKPVLLVKCDSDLKLASFLLTVTGMIMVLTFFGFKLKILFFRLF